MKKLLVPLVALALVAGVSGTAEAAPKRKKFKVSVSASATLVNAGATVAIRGKVGPRARGKKVVLLQKHHATGKWLKVRERKLNKKSRYVFRVKPGVGVTEYRVRKPKQRKIKAGASRVLAVTVHAVTPPTTPTTPTPTPTPTTPTAATVTVVEPAVTSIDAGQQFVLSGTASANLAGKTVQLQVMAEPAPVEDNWGDVVEQPAAWTTVGTTTVASDASFTVRAPATTSKRGQQVRVVAPATSSTRLATSNVVLYDVFAWFYLSERSSVQGDFTSGSYNVNGITYPRSIRSYDRFSNSSAVQFDLSRKCTRFRSVAGVGDWANSNALYDAQVYADDVERWSVTNAGLGSSTEVDVDLTGALRVRFGYTRRAGSTQSFVHGDARIRCAF